MTEGSSGLIAGDKKEPHSSGGGELWGNVLLGGFENGCHRLACHSKSLSYLQVACHNNPLMFGNLSGC